MVRIPEMARALDQICRGMKDKPGGERDGDVGSSVHDSRQTLSPPAQWGAESGRGGCFWAPALLPRAESLSLSLPSALSLSFLFSFPLSSSAPSHSWQFQPHPSFWDIG